MHRQDVTALILTYNEEPNIARVLRQLRWVPRIVVVDSHSTDRTLEILQSFDNVDFVTREFDSHASQWNYGKLQIDTQWTLALDADYVCPAELLAEIQSLDGQQDAYECQFRYLVYGRPLRGSLYPARPVLFRTHSCHFVQDGHTQRLKVTKRIGQLQVRIDHDDRKSLDRWLQSQVRYADLESSRLAHVPFGSAGWKDKIRKMIFLAPLLTMSYTLIVKGVALDGWKGWHYALQRTYAELLLSMKLLESKLCRDAANATTDHVGEHAPFSSSTTTESKQNVI